jgi:quercetin dioxygenase-like cupin family protein
MALTIFDLFAQQAKVQIAQLVKGDTTGLASIREAFMANNPGYDLAYLRASTEVHAQDRSQVIFIQEGEGTARIVSNNNQQESVLTVGDIVLLRRGEKMEADSSFGLLVFTVPEAPEDDVPGFIRPDWDPHITDIPGGCATETNAYRRILLTWKSDVGKYLYHAINAHRVRITDSFSHYHPKTGGFDEFYLVQMVQPNARIITSDKTELIAQPEKVTKEAAQHLMQEYALSVGDLVYLPRGIVHRGIGGVLAQVITVPGFIPGSEIGVDHHLRRINERLGLRGKATIPFNMEASSAPMIK